MNNIEKKSLIQEETNKFSISKTCNVSPAGLLTPRDASIYLGISISTLASWRLYKRFNLNYIKVGKRIMYRQSDLDEWIISRSRSVSNIQ